MAIRTETYVAFDSGDNIDITSGDIESYNLMKVWSKGDLIFDFINSYDMIGNPSVISSEEIIKTHLKDRVSSSKRMILILSSKTKPSNKYLNYEIEQALLAGISILQANVDPNPEIPDSIKGKARVIGNFTKEEVKSFINRT